MNKYLFTIRFHHLTCPSVTIDSWYKVEDVPDLPTEALKVANRIQTANGKPSLGAKTDQTVMAMKLRSRFNNDIDPRIFLVKVPDGVDFTVDEALCMLQSHEERGTLREFLQEARL